MNWPVTLPFGWVDAVDILLVAFLVYQALLFIKESQAMRILQGLLPLVILYVISGLLGLHTIYWFLGKLATVILLILVVVFQPELRRTLELLGRRRFYRFLTFKHGSDTNLSIPTIKHILEAVADLSQRHWGAIILVERGFRLSDYINTGLNLGARLSSDLLITIFNPSTLTHDGAVVIRKDRIVASNVLLPLTKKNLETRYGTRHRAAIGISELSDAVSIVVSEESGAISLVEYGNIFPNLNKESLEERLFEIFHINHQPKPSNP